MTELPADVAAAFRRATDSLAWYLQERTDEAHTACLRNHEAMLSEIQAAVEAEPQLDWSAHRFHAETVIEMVNRLGVAQPG